MYTLKEFLKEISNVEYKNRINAMLLEIEKIIEETDRSEEHTSELQSPS